MSVTITAKLNKDASVFDAGDSKGFGLRLGERYYDRETQQKEWTNYQCAIFAKNQAQIDFYSKTLVAGSIVSITADQQKICSFDGQNGTVLYIEMVGARLQNVYDAEPSDQSPQQQASAPAAQQPPAQQPTPAPAPSGGFDDDIPF